MTDLICIGVPYWLGEKTHYTGSVDAIKNAGIAAEIGAAWVEITPDFTDVPDALTAANKGLAAAIAAQPDKLPLIFAADCTSCLGAMKGLEKQQPAVIWYDGHGDFNTPETTPSGFAGGMPLAALVGRGNQHWLSAIGLTSVAEKDVMITDARDLDPQEGDNLRASGITLLPQLDQLLTQPLPDKPLYLHFDTDVVRLEDMPAMSYPAAGGASLETTIATVRRLLHERKIAGILFSLWNNHLPGADKALNSTLQIVRAMVQELQA
jgi:arginase